MKILCLCSGGNVRSVATATELKRHGHDAIAAGIHKNSPELIYLLSHWAEKILLAEAVMADQLPIDVKDKVDTNFQLGYDVWNDPTKDTLIQKVRGQLVDMRLIASPFKYER